MKMVVAEIAQFAADSILVRNYFAEVLDGGSQRPKALAADQAAERIRNLAHRMMGADVMFVDPRVVVKKV